MNNSLSDVRQRLEQVLPDAVHHPDLPECLAQDADALDRLSDTINHDLGLEQIIAAVRRRLLVAARDPAGSDRWRALCVALAHQAFNNEYVLSISPDEHAQLAELDGDPSQRRDGITVADAERRLIVWSMFRPPADSYWADWLERQPAPTVADDVRKLLVRALAEPRDEAALAARIPTLGAIVDETTRTVREVYERHPYPRWLHVKPSGRTVAQQARRLRPDFTVAESATRPQFLIAGCGTGHHPIRVALDNPGADILAMDASRSALGHGARKALDLGVANIQWLHGDLLQISTMRRQFDHIECGGVLHHMSDRRRAWHELIGALRPGGTLRIAVYSRVGRLLIEHVRSTVPFPSLAEPGAVQRLRAALIAAPESQTIVAQLARTSDFFTTSMFRDLLFHVYEHPYTVAELEAAAADGRVELLGVNVPRALRNAVEARDADVRWPVTSFAQWKAIEWAYVGTAVMFRFWLWKPAS